jgi:hypothetical protein
VTCESRGETEEARRHTAPYRRCDEDHAGPASELRPTQSSRMVAASSPPLRR